MQRALRLLLLAVLAAPAACGGSTQDQPPPPPLGSGPASDGAHEGAGTGPGAAAPTPEIAPPPFTAEQIRDATQPGRTYRFRVEEKGKPAVLIELEFVSVNDAGATVERRVFDADGKPSAKPQRTQPSWQELVGHASFPAAATEIGESEVDTPAGHFDCKLYTVKAGDQTLRYYFARSLPGAPVRLEGVEGGEVVSSMTLLAHTPGRASEGGAEVAATDGPKEITFSSEDGLEITADLYMPHADAQTPFIVLFHQAGWSRGEYREIAPRLGRLGFNCMAIDQRSGGEVNRVRNQTHLRARKAGQKPTYLDALQDLRAALAYARKHYAHGVLIAWGSSYSSGLVLRLAGEHPELADGFLAFSPGEYYSSLGKSDHWIRDAAKKIQKPVFITSARGEKKRWAPIYAAIPSKNKQSFRPKTGGHHGSRALWSKFPDSQAYWTAVESFLRQNFLKK